MPTESAPDEATTATRLERALESATIGAAVTFAGLSQLGGVGDIEVQDGGATVPIRFPAPGRSFKAMLVDEIESVAADVDGVETVTVRWEPAAPDPGVRVEFLPNVKNVIAVGSGKGGVGKSTVATNLAVGLAAAGLAVGLVDTDVYGPNAPKLLGLDDRKPETTLEDQMVPRSAYGVSVMSMGFITDEEDPIIWRGPVVDDFVKQMFGDVAWGDLDFLIVDLPPGTGDVQLSLVQHLPVTGAVLVTTPQAVAVDDARRGLEAFARYDVPILGIVENMSGFACPDCGSAHDIFDTGGGDRLSEAFDVPVLGRIPLDPSVNQPSPSDDSEESSETLSGRGISIPGLGRLSIPRTRAERERERGRGESGETGSNAPVPILHREDDGELTRAIELTVVRTVARTTLTSHVQ